MQPASFALLSSGEKSRIIILLLYKIYSMRVTGIFWRHYTVVVKGKNFEALHHTLALGPLEISLLLTLVFSPVKWG